MEAALSTTTPAENLRQSWNPLSLYTWVPRLLQGLGDNAAQIYGWCIGINQMGPLNWEFADSHYSTRRIRESAESLQDKNLQDDKDILK